MKLQRTGTKPAKPKPTKQRAAIVKTGRISLFAVAVVSGVLWFATRPEPLVIASAASFDSSQTQILDRDGELIQTVRSNFNQRRGQWVSLSDISPAMIDLVTRAEDQRFWQHRGVDWLAFGGALKQNIVNIFRQKSTASRGASTITMQLAGLLRHDRPNNERRSITDKIQQVRLSWQIESSYSKQQILEAYLNTVTFRGEIQGVDAAAAALFAKTPLGLQSKEAAILATLISAPQARVAVVAKRACRLLDVTSGNLSIGALSANAKCDPDDLPTTRLARPRAGAIDGSDNIAPHAARLVIAGQTGPAATPEATKHLTSTLSANVQRAARTALSEQMRELARQRVEDGAIVVLDNATGDVIAYVGSSGEFSGASEVDAANAPRQAGSTLKPFLYAQAIEQRRITAASLIDDSELAIRTSDAQYLPRNYSEDFKGWVSVRKALAGSLNIPAVRTLSLLDIDDFVGTLKMAGLNTLNKEGGFYGYSLALGSADVKLLELTNAYRTLANGGLQTDVRFNRPTIVDSKSPKGNRVFTQATTMIVNDILADNNARAVSFGLDSALKLPFRASVKTGTSKDMRDNWCIGFSDRYTVGVWVGNVSGVAMRGVSGVTGAAPIWRALMQYLHVDLAHQPEAQKPAVDGLIKQTVHFNGVREADRTELFLSGTQMTTIDLNVKAKSGIVRPLNGAVYAIDPDIPQARQTIWFEAESGNKNYSWRINGQDLSAKDVPSQAIHWALRPGKHQLTLLDINRAVLDQIVFEVKAPARVATNQARLSTNRVN